MKYYLIVFAVFFSFIMLSPNYISKAENYINDCEENNISIIKGDIFADNNEEHSRIVQSVTGNDWRTYWDQEDNSVVTVYINASFLYDGVSATCIANGSNYTIWNSSFEYDYVNAGRSGNSAWVNYRFINHHVMFIIGGQLSISCDPDGTLHKYQN